MALVSVSIDDVVQYLRRQGKFADVVRAAGREKQIVDAARNAGISVTTTELQHYSNLFRLQRGLSSAVDTAKWLESHGMTVDDWQDQIENTLLKTKLFNQLVAKSYGEVFEANRASFAKARLTSAVLPSENAAQELLCKMRHEDVAFIDAARIVLPTGSDLEEVTVMRLSLDAEIAKVVFSSTAGDVVGPFSTSRGFEVCQVLALFDAQPDDETLGRLEEMIVSEWIRETISPVVVATCP